MVIKFEFVTVRVLTCLTDHFFKTKGQFKIFASKQTHNSNTMFCDVFNKQQALKLLKDKHVWFIGSSNMRAIYKDLLWLITHESVTPVQSFQTKNELHFLNDKRISNGILHNGRNYKETREFKIGNTYIFFHFITRLYIDHFIDLINDTAPENFPDVLFINSCLWDLTRWGPYGPENFRVNILKTMKFLKSKIPSKTRIIWKTALPVSLNANGAIFVDEIKFIVPMLPWHILEANIYAGTCANFFNFDTLDFHHHMRLQGHLRAKDGIHWQPIAVRYLTNLFLTHLCFVFGHTMPGNFLPSIRYLCESTRIVAKDKVLENRVNKKQGLFQKLFKKAEDTIKTSGCMQGITNKVLTLHNNILKRKPRNAYKNKLKSVNNTKPNYFESNLNENKNLTHSTHWNRLINTVRGSYNVTDANRNYNKKHSKYSGNYRYRREEQNYYSQYNFPA